VNHSPWSGPRSCRGGHRRSTGVGATRWRGKVAILIVQRIRPGGLRVVVYHVGDERVAGSAHGVVVGRRHADRVLDHPRRQPGDLHDHRRRPDADARDERSGVQIIHTNPTVRLPSSAFLGLQIVFALPGRQPDGTQWDSLDCQLGTPVGGLRRTAAQMLGVSLRTPLPPPAERGPDAYQRVARDRDDVQLLCGRQSGQRRLRRPDVQHRPRRRRDVRAADPRPGACIRS
jgi:hypothetical protein